MTDQNDDQGDVRRVAHFGVHDQMGYRSLGLPSSVPLSNPLHQSSMLVNLKEASPGIPQWTGRSDELVATALAANSPVRSTYLRTYLNSPPPVISSSEFVPPLMVEHLMRNKRDSALGVKYKEHGRDEITNMEGAMHTFVTPLALIRIHGDYIYRARHGVVYFPEKGGNQQARAVVMSALIQPDFENEEVMLALTSLGDSQVIGEELPVDFSIPSKYEKQDRAKRSLYDTALRRHLVAGLTSEGVLPTMKEAFAKTVSFSQAIGRLEDVIMGRVDGDNALSGTFVTLRNLVVISLEMLWTASIHQARNEFSSLEHLCPQGYVYTFDPPAIFAKEIGATILNRVYFAALRTLVSCTTLPRMRAFGFNDYADEDAIGLLTHVFSSHPHVHVMRKADLFPAPKHYYVAPASAVGALLVIHNNSDAFGQNIETEYESSLDGVIGTHSSAAASLHRRHPQLTKFTM